MTEPRVHNRYHNTAPKDAVYIGRGTILGNPFRIGDNTTRDQACDRYIADAGAIPGFRSMVRRHYKGKHLICSCKPKRCHGDWLLEVANSEETPDELANELENLRKLKHAIIRRLNIELDAYDFRFSESEAILDIDRFAFYQNSNVKLSMDSYPISTMQERPLLDILQTAVECSISVLFVLARELDEGDSHRGQDASIPSYLIAASVALIEGQISAQVYERFFTETTEDEEIVWITGLIKCMQADLLNVLLRLLLTSDGSFVMDVLYNDTRRTVFRTKVKISERSEQNKERDVRLTIQALSDLTHSGKRLTLDDIYRAVHTHRRKVLEQITKGLTDREALLAMKLDGDPPF